MDSMPGSVPPSVPQIQAGFLSKGDFRDHFHFPHTSKIGSHVFLFFSVFLGVFQKKRSDGKIMSIFEEYVLKPSGATLRNLDEK